MSSVLYGQTETGGFSRKSGTFQKEVRQIRRESGTKEIKGDFGLFTRYFCPKSTLEKPGTGQTLRTPNRKLALRHDVRLFLLTRREAGVGRHSPDLVRQPIFTITKQRSGNRGVRFYPDASPVVYGGLCSLQTGVRASTSLDAKILAI
jgi:hypothetical protein